jgi:hypothetical protein
MKTWKFNALAFNKPTTDEKNLNVFCIRGAEPETNSRHRSVTFAGSVCGVFSLVLVLLILCSVSAWAQAPLNVGDIIVADATAEGRGAVIRVNPVTGAQVLVSSNQFFVNPVGIAVELDQNILVTDRSAKAVIRVNPLTGTQTIVWQGAPFVEPWGIAIEPNGNIVITDIGYVPGGAVFRLNPITGPPQLVTSGGFLESPYGIAVEATGNFVISEAQSTTLAPLNPQARGGIIRVNAVTGTQTIVSVGSKDSNAWGCPFGITVEDTGTILTTLFDVSQGYGCAGRAGVWRADPVLGTQTPVSTDPPYAWNIPFGLHTEADGMIVSVEEYYQGVWRVAPAPGSAPAVVSQNGFFRAPIDLQVILPAPTPPELPPTASTPGKVTGGGVFDLVTGDPLTETEMLIVKGMNAGVGGRATFGLNAKFVAGAAAPTGSVSYRDHDVNLTIKSTAITLVLITGTHAQIKFKCTVGGVPDKNCQVDVDDFGTAGSDLDTFSIKTDTGYSAAGVLRGGNIEVH